MAPGSADAAPNCPNRCPKCHLVQRCRHRVGFKAVLALEAIKSWIRLFRTELPISYPFGVQPCVVQAWERL